MRIKVKTTKTHQLFFFTTSTFFKIELSWSAKVFLTSNSDFKESFVNWDFVLSLPPVTNLFFTYLYIFVTNKLN